MTTLEKLQAAYAQLEEAKRLLESTNYSILADPADELLVDIDHAVTAEELVVEAA